MSTVEPFGPKKTEVVAIYNAAVGPLLIENGFVYKKTKNEYVKKTKYFFLEIEIGVRNYWPLCQKVIPLAVVYNLKISKLMKDFFGGFESTIIETFPLKNADDYEGTSYYSLSQVKESVGEVYDIVKNEIIPFCEEYQSLEKIAAYYLPKIESVFVVIYYCYLVAALRLGKDERYHNYRNKIMDELEKKEKFHGYFDTPEGQLQLVKFIEHLDNLG